MNFSYDKLMEQLRKASAEVDADPKLREAAERWRIAKAEEDAKPKRKPHPLDFLDVWYDTSHWNGG